MASAVAKSTSPEGFLDLTFSSAACSSYGRISPRASSSGSCFDGEDAAAATAKFASIQTPDPVEAAAEAVDLVDFEFLRLDDPITMLPADELFSDGKLVPLQGASAQPPAEVAAFSSTSGSAAVILSPEPRGESVRAGAETAFDAKGMPRHSSRWRDLLGLKKAAQSGRGARQDGGGSFSLSSDGATGTKSRTARSLKHFLPRSRKTSSVDPSLNLPLLGDSETELAALSSRLSLSSSSPSPQEREDVPRLSLDSDKSTRNLSSLARVPPRVRLSPKPAGGDLPGGSGPGGKVLASHARRMPGEAVAIPADSPRMNSSGKVVFHSLERSTSSPSTFNGGPRAKPRGMERSYSAHVVRVTPVLNVPMCSLRGSSKAGSVFGFGHLFSSSQKKDAGGGSSAAGRNGSAAARSAKIERLQ